ncbi:MAG: mucoidy inhibitor MuiA family protein [Anaerolineae bacterium]|nr:mucoidy inhibitor MuiA family protein [Anaerolineae bacterium]
MKIESPIVAVTVYPDRARVTRRGVVVLKETGAQDLVVADLTRLLDPESVRVGGEGAARVRLIGVDVREQYYIETPSVPAAELERKIQDKKDADQALADEDVSLQEQIGFLSGLTASAGESLARGIGRGRAQVTDGETLLGFVGAQHKLLADRRREIAVQRREIAKEIEVLQQELKRIQGARPRQRYEAVVGVEVLSPGEFTLDLEYTTRGGASWQPLYDLRLLTEEGDPQVELTYLGEVKQSTGEDWLGVDLTLSTARPSVSAQIPELSTWYVDILRPLPPPSAAPAIRGMGMVADMEVMRKAEFSLGAAVPAPEALPPAPAEVMQASVDTSGAAVTFHIPRKADIPADNTPHKTTVLLLRFAPKLDFVAVPKQSDEVYRRATIQNKSEVTLLPGPLTLFHGGEFVGRANLVKVAPGEEFETTLGIDDRIKVERELALDEVGKQFIGDRRVHRYAYEVKVQNLLPCAATVVVKDQLPVAANEEIKIKAEPIVPEPAQQTDLGELTWELSLAAQQKQTIRFEFTVTAPRSQTVTGLP